ncbi:MAG: hypothetical protein V3S41_03160 [Spirochaetia bacterium]
MDGVLVDFDSGVQAVTGLPPNQQSPRRMWPPLARTAGFYENLDWLADGRNLWTQVRSLEPTILTGLPFGTWAEPQKRAWCTRELGHDIPVITCMSREKASRARKAAPTDAVPVLIDDREFLKQKFEAAGGVFIHYSDTHSAVAQLEALRGRFVPTVK